MKKAMVIGVAILFILLLVTSCGVSQELYENVRTDLITAQVEIETLRGNLSTAQSEKKALQDDLSTAQSEKQALENDLDAVRRQIKILQDDLLAQESEVSNLESDLESAREKLEEGNARIEILNAILIPSITGELYRMTESESMNYFFEWRDKVIAVGDPTLTAKFQAIIDTLSDEATSSFFLYLLESIPKALGYHDVSSSGI
jgi:predicted nuclease with TOPRIM domain